MRRARVVDIPNMQTFRIVECRHVFCGKCLREHFANAQGRNVCPVCRTSVLEPPVGAEPLIYDFASVLSQTNVAGVPDLSPELQEEKKILKSWFFIFILHSSQHE